MNIRVGLGHYVVEPGVGYGLYVVEPGEGLG